MKKILDVIINDIRNFETVVAEIRDNENINPLELEIAALKAQNLHQELLLLAQNLKSCPAVKKNDEQNEAETSSALSSIPEEISVKSHPNTTSPEENLNPSSIESSESEITTIEFPEDTLDENKQTENNFEDESALEPPTEAETINEVDAYQNEENLTGECESEEISPIEQSFEAVDLSVFPIDQPEEIPSDMNESELDTETEKYEASFEEESFQTNEPENDGLENNVQEIPSKNDLSAIEAAVKSLKQEVVETEPEQCDVLQEIRNENNSLSTAEETESTVNIVHPESSDKEISQSLIDELIAKETETFPKEENEFSSIQKANDPEDISIAETNQETEASISETNAPPLNKGTEEEIATSEAAEHTISESINSETENEYDQVSTQKENIVPIPTKEIALNEEPAQKAESVVTVLGEKFASKVRSINDIFSSKVKVEKNPFENAPLNSLKSSITLNDRFLFIKDLFEGNQVQYSEAIEKLDSCENIRDAVGYLKTNYRWHHSEASQKFLELVKQRFAN